MRESGRLAVVAQKALCWSSSRKLWWVSEYWHLPWYNYYWERMIPSTSTSSWLSPEYGCPLPATIEASLCGASLCGASLCAAAELTICFFDLQWRGNTSERIVQWHISQCFGRFSFSRIFALFSCYCCFIFSDISSLLSCRYSRRVLSGITLLTQLLLRM
mgnify:CR=1 FL=1